MVILHVACKSKSRKSKLLLVLEIVGLKVILISLELWSEGHSNILRIVGLKVILIFVEL